jgi:hypothetical protein
MFKNILRFLVLFILFDYLNKNQNFSIRENLHGDDQEHSIDR